MGAGINPLAVFLAGLSLIAVGFVWYSPMLFAEPWMRLSGLRREDVKAKRNLKNGAVQALCAFATAFTLAYFLDRTATFTLGESLVRATLAWAGFTATTLIGAVLWGGRPFKLYVLNASYYLVAFWVMASILFVLK